MKIKHIALAAFVISLSGNSICDGQGNNETNKPIVRFSGQLKTKEASENNRVVDPNEFWRGVWKEDTNGWRVQLKFNTNKNDLRLIVQWGSAIKDSGGSFFLPPNNKYAKFELLDVHGNVVPFKPTAGANLLGQKEAGLIYKTNLPVWATPSGGTLAVDFPQIISAAVYPQILMAHSPRIVLTNGRPYAIGVSETNYYPWIPGGIMARKDFPPATLNIFEFGDLYSITNESEYTLTVQPVLFKWKNGLIGRDKTGTLERVDLPSVTTKVHLLPSPSW